jgi:phage-related protein
MLNRVCGGLRCADVTAHPKAAAAPRIGNSTLSRWIGSAREDLKEFPAPVRQIMGTALYLAQTGGKHLSAKPLKGIAKGAGVLEVVDDHDANTYRPIYTVRFAGAVYVLHAFQKKSKKGIKTPLHEIDLIQARYEKARIAYEHEFGGPKGRTR